MNTKSQVNGAAQQDRLWLEGQSDGALFLLDSGGYVLDWTSSAERLLGYRRDEILGKHFCLLFFRPEEVRRGEPECELRTAAVNGRVVVGRWYVRKDGTALWCCSVTAALQVRGEGPQVFVKVMQERTGKELGEQPSAADDVDNLHTVIDNCSKFLGKKQSTIVPNQGTTCAQLDLLVSVPGQN